LTRHYYFRIAMGGYSVVVSATVKDWDYKAKRTGEPDSDLITLAPASAALMWEDYTDVLPVELVDRLEDIL